MRPEAPRLGEAERRLLLACGRVELDTERAAETRALLAEPLDWEAIAFYARLHSVGPLVQHHLREVGEGRVPRGASRALLALHQRSAYQNRIYARENAVLIDAFRSAGVPSIVPKGLSIAERAYGGLARRPLIDLIFLVPPAAIEDAARVLAEHGYRRERIRPVQALFRWRFPQTIFKRRGGDLHVAIVLQEGLVTWPRAHGLSTERIFSEARTASLGDREVLLPSPVDQVIYLALQADNHGYFNRAALGLVEPVELLFSSWSNNRLVRFTDIYEVIRSEGEAVDWDLLVDRAHETLLEDAVHASLSLTAALLGPAIPSPTLARLEPTSRPRLRRWLAVGVAPLDGDARPPARLAGSGWRSLSARRQIRLAQLIGLGEYAFPMPATLQRLDGGGGVPRALRYARHAGGTAARTASSFAAAVLRRAAPGASGDE
jgi:hypothetical protein